MSKVDWSDRRCKFRHRGWTLGRTGAGLSAAPDGCRE